MTAFTPEEFPIVAKLQDHDSRDGDIIAAFARLTRTVAPQEQAGILAEMLAIIQERHDSAHVLTYREWNAIKVAAEFLRGLGQGAVSFADHESIRPTPGVPVGSRHRLSPAPRRRLRRGQ